MDPLPSLKCLTTEKAFGSSPGYATKKILDQHHELPSAGDSKLQLNQRLQIIYIENPYQNPETLPTSGNDIAIGHDLESPRPPFSTASRCDSSKIILVAYLENGPKVVPVSSNIIWTANDRSSPNSVLVLQLYCSRSFVHYTVQ